MKYQKEVEVDITPVPEDLVDVEELLRVVLNYLDENEFMFGDDLTWNFDAVVERWEEVGEILGRMAKDD